MSKTDDVTNSFGTKINLKIKNISESIEGILFKLGTSNVCQVRTALLVPSLNGRPSIDTLRDILDFVICLYNETIFRVRN